MQRLLGSRTRCETIEERHPRRHTSSGWERQYAQRFFVFRVRLAAKECIVVGALQVRSRSRVRSQHTHFGEQMALLAPQWSDGNWRTKGWLRQAELNSPPLFLGQPGRYSNDPVTFAASAGAVRVFQTVYNRIAFGLPLLRLPFLPIPPGVSVPLPLPGAI